VDDNPSSQANRGARTTVRTSWETFFETWTVEEAESTIDEVIVFGDRACSRGLYAETCRSNTDGADERAQTADLLISRPIRSRFGRRSRIGYHPRG